MRFNFVLLTRIIGIYVLFTIDQVEGFEGGYKSLDHLFSAALGDLHTKVLEKMI